MPKIVDRVGDRYGRLLVLDKYDTKHGQSRWVCRCDCGATRIVYTTSLVSGTTRSCGCLQRELSAKRGKSKFRKHGHHGTLTYSRWLKMWARVRYEPTYQHVTVHPSWTSFEQFLEDMGPCPDGLSLDRIDNYKGYAPLNCRWVPRSQQTANRRCNTWITINGETKILLHWCQQLDKNYQSVRSRLRRGSTSEEALDLVPRQRKRAPKGAPVIKTRPKLKQFEM